MAKCDRWWKTDLATGPPPNTSSPRIKLNRGALPTSYCTLLGLFDRERASTFLFLTVGYFVGEFQKFGRSSRT